MVLLEMFGFISSLHFLQDQRGKNQKLPKRARNVALLMY